MQRLLQKEQYVFLFLLSVGVTSSYFLYPYAKGYPYQFGPQMIGLFIPPFLTSLYLFYFFYLNQLNRKQLLKSVLLFFLQLSPFYPLFFLETAPYPGEDLARNMIYAKNMLANQTLWGGDELLFDVNSKSFITQPGYRYFVALELLVFQKLYRFVSILNLTAVIGGIYLYYKVIHTGVSSQKVKILLALVALLSVPYATKNVLMGLSEWLTVLLLILSAYFFIKKKNIAFTVILLALVVFIRQNLLPPVLLLTLIIIISNQSKIKNSLVFLFVLLLPVYHNLYYQQEFRFFISIFNYPFLRYSHNNLSAIGVNYHLLLNNILHYCGVHLKKGGVDFIEESVPFLWLFIYLFFYILRKYFSGILRLLFLLVMCSIIIPTIILATDFYPRFEFVVLYIFLVTVPILEHCTNVSVYAVYFPFVRKKQV